jgi:hypothetical protein
MCEVAVKKADAEWGAGMRVLLIHPDDDFKKVRGKTWDLMIDMGRAPVATYHRWEQLAGCEIRSLHDCAQEIEDLYIARRLLQPGFGGMVDRHGVDWWEILVPELLPNTLNLMLVERQARLLGPGCELCATRPSWIASALAARLGVGLNTAGSSWWKRRLRYGSLLTRLDGKQLAQLFEDKFRTNRLARVFSGDPRPVILLPSAYVNGSRTAIHLAERMPQHDFLLMYTRSSGKLPSLPANVRMNALRVDSSPGDSSEMAELLAGWEATKAKLIAQSKEFTVADSVGAFDHVRTLLRHGISMRDAWLRVFDSANLTGLICTDDSNPPTRIPLVLAMTRGLPTAICHHGALDYLMAVKPFCADSYIAKSSLEGDYLDRVCRLPADKILELPSPPEKARDSFKPSVDGDWLVFFSEPYDDKYWRSDEIYAELIPQLIGLSIRLGLKLVFKIHPFESVKAHRRRLERFAGDDAAKMKIIAGPPLEELYRKTRIAITVQSTTALECARRGIPVFLCAWLRDAYSGYVAQFARFGVGYPLSTAAEIADIPELLDRTPATQVPLGKQSQSDGTNRLSRCSQLANRTRSRLSAERAFNRHR